MKERIFRRQNLAILVFTFPILLYISHALLFGNWIIDDAGVSFVYSRNLALGYGLTSQPGIEPVEGYSNFSWVILMTPFFFIDLFNPIVTPKVVSILLVIILFFTLNRILCISSNYPNSGNFFTLTLLAINTSFVVWTISGLENPLYVLLLMLIAYILLLLGKDIDLKYRLIYITLLALLVSLSAMTRPDGILFLLVPLIILVFDHLVWKPANQNLIIEISIYIIFFILTFGGFITFRFFYFGDIFPNTYYVKGWLLSQFNIIPVLLPIFMLFRIPELFSSVSVRFGIVILISLMIIFFYLLRFRKMDRSKWLILLLLFFSASIYVILPPDWMDEFRFATPFLVFIYIFIYLSFEAIFSIFENREKTKLLFPLIFIVIFIVLNLIEFIPRSLSFLLDPTVPFLAVQEQYGTRFNKYAHVLNLDDGSILCPDVGGTLYASELRVYDLGGLTDKLIAKTFGKNQGAFYDYIFNIAKPTFIHTHGYWAYKANFDADSRFREQYVPIQENSDPWITDRYNLNIYSGDYVRKEVLSDQLGDLINSQNDQP